MCGQCDDAARKDDERAEIGADRDALECAQLLYQRFCEDMMSDPAKARSRLIAGIQVALDAATEAERERGERRRKTA